jgi:hypothetical protein
VETTIFDGHVLILKRDGKYFIRYEAGGSAGYLEDLEVTEEEAQRAQKSWDEAYDIVVGYQMRAAQKKKLRGS